MNLYVQNYTGIFRFKVRLMGYLREEREYLSIRKNSLVREWSWHITQLEEYAKSRIVNPLAFTVEDLLEATNDYTEKGVEFLSLEPQPTLKVLFYGPNHPLLHLLERALYLFLRLHNFCKETLFLLQK
ncbi:VOC family protein [Priestia megaterium]|uniref:VOC family protein n=1 Tax=Priestia megaterium TaxID=1404 RepID=UPI001B3A1564|nr:VOC family protein [Priestia megaterium]